MYGTWFIIYLLHIFVCLCVALLLESKGDFCYLESFGGVLRLLFLLKISISMRLGVVYMELKLDCV